MTEERRKVLDMLAAGKITPEDAEQLLNRLSASEKKDETPQSEVFEAASDVRNGKDPKTLRYLRVFVDSPNRDNVNIRLPLKLVRTGIKLSALIPGKAGKHLSEQGIDLSHLGKLNGDALNEALAELDIDIETEKGEKVRIFCE